MILKNLIMILILIVPFFRGLYFYHSQFIFTAVLSIILVLVIIKNKKVYICCNLRSYCAYVLIALYGISIIYAVDFGMALFGFLKWFGVLIFYFIISQIYDKNFKEKYLSITAYSAMLLAILGILGAFVPILNSICYQKNRLGSFIQYANALSVFLLIGYIIIVFKDKKNIIDKISLTILICAIFLTFSRSMNCITFCVLLILLINDKKKLKIILITYVSGMFLGYIISNVSGLIVNINRVTNTLDFKASEWQCRLAYYSDALNIIKQNIFGLGYLGYFYSQKIYQSALYYVKYVHSSFLQIGLDVGILGMICSILILYDYFFKCKKNFKELMIVIIIFAHSLMDFDLEFPIFLMLISVLFVDENDVKELKIDLKKIKSLIAINLIVYLYFGTVSLCNYLGQVKISSKMYPYYTQANIQYGKQLLNAEIENDNIKGEKILKNIIKRNKYYQVPYTLLSDYYLDNKMYKNAVIYSEFSKKTAPLEIKFVEKYSQTLLISAKYAIIKKDFEQAKDYLLRILNIQKELGQKEKKISSRAYKLAHTPNLKFNNKLQRITQEANQLLKEV